MTPNIAEAVIQSESNSIHFEEFCRDLCQRAEGIPLVPTSKTYDQGRDARSFGPTLGTHKLVICASLERDIETKVQEDISHLAATTVPERVLYCCSGRLSEYAIDTLTAQIRTVLPPETSIGFLALEQLAALAVQDPATLRRHYASELQAIDTLLNRFETTGEQADASLRLALVTLASEDARLLREEISQKAVLQVLQHAGMPVASSDIAFHLSTDLRLPTSINGGLIEAALNGLVKLGHIRSENELWSLTPGGRDEATSISSDVAKDILRGATVIRDALQELTGYQLTDKHFATLWSTLLDYLSNLFHSKGLSVVSAINDFVSGKATEDAPLEDLVIKGAAQIRATASIPEMGEALEQAVVDILTERSGAAFEWLSKVCERFIALCSLGLEASSTDEIRRVIAKYKLILDSDIVITTLCAGEPGHQPTREILARWVRLGGQIVFAAPVLEEVAYHAYISDRDFQETRRLSPALKGLDLRRYCNNAFVRAFYTLENDHNHWTIFRGMYIGETPHDYSKILEILRDTLLSEFMPPSYSPKLALEIKEYLLSISSEAEQIASEYFSDPGRLGRDGQLLATIANAREREREARSDARIVLLSSSTRLRMADTKFRSALGNPEAVISRGAVSYLIALIPEAGLSVGTLRKALFDFGETAHLADTERFALRVIKSAGAYIMPWAQRTHLKRQLETNLRREAEKSGVPAKQFKLEFTAGNEKTHPAALIAMTIKDMALKDPEKAILHQELRQLERKLEAVTRKQAGKKIPKRKPKKRPPQKH